MVSRRDTYVKIWSLPLRVFHWALAASIATAWLTQDGPGSLHDGSGYMALGLIGFRLGWSVFGKMEERLTQFIHGWTATLEYTRMVLSRTEPRYLGHNPLGGWMIVALLIVASFTSLSGWLYVTDHFWGVSWVVELHAFLANILWGLVLLHVAGVIFTSHRQGENLISAMIQGRKSRTTDKHPEDVIKLQETGN